MSTQSKRQSAASRKIDRLLRVLDEQHRVLVAVGGDKKVIAEHDALIRFLKTASPTDLRRIFTAPSLLRSAGKSPEPQLSLEPELSEADLADIPSVEVERIIGNESTPRKYLERIAVHRFKVPQGSMRSFGNRTMLVEKLQTMLRNEQAHVAIESLARRHM